jgi:hypothetical protein
MSPAPFGKLTRVLLFLSMVFVTSVTADDQLTFSVSESFSIFDRIQFVVPGGWRTIANKSTDSQAVFVFRISNPANEGTPSSATSTLFAYNLTDVEASAAFAKKQSVRTRETRQVRLVPDWECKSVATRRGQTEYSDFDCFRAIGQIGINVQVAWPHLRANPPGYRDTLKAVFIDFLRGVQLYPVASRPPSH